MSAKLCSRSLRCSTVKGHPFNWTPDRPDPRDFRLSLRATHLGALPRTVDLRHTDVPVMDQGSLGSCTGNGIAACHLFNQIKQKKAKPFQPSRLMIYYLERMLEGTINEDAGAQIRDGFKVLGKYGVCPETLWPYTIKKFATKPPLACYTEALKNQSLKYSRVTQTQLGLMDCISGGFPFAFGFSVFESFEADATMKSGIVPYPVTSKEQNLGGHCVIGIGYTDDLRKVHSKGDKLVLAPWMKKVTWWLIVQNSWGTGVGDKGFFYFPGDFITNNDMADDFWQSQLVE